MALEPLLGLADSEFRFNVLAKLQSLIGHKHCGGQGPGDKTSYSLRLALQIPLQYRLGFVSMYWTD